jgi:hypothetical protein
VADLEDEIEEERERRWGIYLILLVVAGVLALVLGVVLVALTDSIAWAGVVVAAVALVTAGLITVLEMDML